MGQAGRVWMPLTADPAVLVLVSTLKQGQLIIGSTDSVVEVLATNDKEPNLQKMLCHIYNSRSFISDFKEKNISEKNKKKNKSMNIVNLGLH